MAQQNLATLVNGLLDKSAPAKADVTRSTYKLPSAANDNAKQSVDKSANVYVLIPSQGYVDQLSSLYNGAQSATAKNKQSPYTQVPANDNPANDNQKPSTSNLMQLMQRHVPQKNQAVPNLFVNPISGNAQSYSTYGAYQQRSLNALYATQTYLGELNIHQTHFIERFSRMSISAYNRVVEIEAGQVRFRQKEDYLKPSIYNGAGKEKDGINFKGNNNAINLRSLASKILQKK